MPNLVTIPAIIYPGAGQAVLLNANQQAVLWNAVATGPGNPINAGTASSAVQLERQKSAFYPWGVSYEILFSAAPGSFEIDLQHADTDTDVAYVTVNQLTVVNSNNSGRVELTNFWTRFCRIRLASITNNVNITAKVTR